MAKTKRKLSAAAKERLRAVREKFGLGEYSPKALAPKVKRKKKKSTPQETVLGWAAV